MDPTLRPLRCPQRHERLQDATTNIRTVEEADLHSDLADLLKLCPPEQHLVSSRPAGEPNRQPFGNWCTGRVSQDVQEISSFVEG